jgi:hypothetical protein
MAIGVLRKVIHHKTVQCTALSEIHTITQHTEIGVCGRPQVHGLGYGWYPHRTPVPPFPTAIYCAGRQQDLAPLCFNTECDCGRSSALPPTAFLHNTRLKAIYNWIESENMGQPWDYWHLLPQYWFLVHDWSLRLRLSIVPIVVTAGGLAVNTRRYRHLIRTDGLFVQVSSTTAPTLRDQEPSPI